MVPTGKGISSITKSMYSLDLAVAYPTMGVSAPKQVSNITMVPSGMEGTSEVSANATRKVEGDFVVSDKESTSDSFIRGCANPVQILALTMIAVSDRVPVNHSLA